MNTRPTVVDGELAMWRAVSLTIAFDHPHLRQRRGDRFVAHVGELVEETSRILLHS